MIVTYIYKYCSKHITKKRVSFKNDCNILLAKLQGIDSMTYQTFKIYSLILTEHDSNNKVEISTGFNKYFQEFIVFYLLTQKIHLY